MTLSRADLVALDGADPLAAVREQFVLPPGVVYLDGNSLGPLPTSTGAAVARVVEREWGEGLIRSWNAAGWIDAPAKVGDKIARSIGARPSEVIVSDSTSVNLFEVLASALDLAQGRRVIVSEAENFPTDLYMMEGLIALLGSRHALRIVPAEGSIGAAVDAETAALAPSIYAEAIRLLARRGFAMSPTALDRDFGVTWRTSSGSGASATSRLWSVSSASSRAPAGRRGSRISESFSTSACSRSCGICGRSSRVVTEDVKLKAR